MEISRRKFANETSDHLQDSASDVHQTIISSTGDARSINLHTLSYLAVAVLFLLLLALREPNHSVINAASVWSKRQQILAGNTSLSCTTAGTTPMPTKVYVPEYLTSLLVCISFRYNVKKLVFLEVVLNSAAAYRTSIDVIIVTDNATSTQNAVAGMHMPFNTTYWEAKPPATIDNGYWLLWEHKAAIQEAVTSKNYTAVLYMEDDQRVTWPALVSWALDAEVLAPTGRLRCIYRTETGLSGTPVLLDITKPIELSKVCTFDAAAEASTAGIYQQTLQAIQGKVCEDRHGQHTQCQLHRYFCAPAHPFQGMFLLTRKQLQEYMSSPVWEKAGALRFKVKKWGYAERSNSIHVLQQIPLGCASNCLVPYVNSTGGGSSTFKLAPLARVEHLRNGYSAIAQTRIAKLPMETAMRL